LSRRARRCPWPARALAIAALSAAAGLPALGARAADGGPPPDGAAPLDGATTGADGARPSEAARDAGADAAPAPYGGPRPDAGAAAPPLPPVIRTMVALRGTVMARGGHRRIRAATVLVDGVVATETDAAGAFALVAPPGRHHLQIEASGFQPSDDVLEIDARGWTGVIRLSPGGRVYETVIAARQPTAAVRVAGEEARTTAGTGGDPFRIIESLPGVSQIVWPFAAYAIRGANPGNTGFFLDGMRVPALYHFALGPSIIHPYLVDKVTFYPGGYPARYGGYVSGAVVADTAPPPNDVFRLAADVRLYDAGALAASPWDGGRGTIAVAARYSYTGLIVARLFPEVSFGYSDYQLRVDHGLFGGRITLLSFGSFDSLNIKEHAIGDAELNFHRIDLRWERAIAGGHFLARTAFATDGASSQLFESPISVRAYTVAPRVAFSRPLSEAATVDVGTEAQAQHFHTDAVQSATGPPLGDLARTRGALTVAAYAGVTVGWRRVSLEPGLRYSYYAEQGVTRGFLEPRLSVRIPIREGTSLEGTFGRFSQLPSLPLAVAGFDGFGLADYGLQTSTQASGGIDTRLPHGFVLRATGFYQWLYVSDLTSTFNMNVQDKEFLEMRPGRGYGAELQLRIPEQQRVSGWLAYTLSWSERDFSGVWGPSDWDQRHILNLVSAVRLPAHWSAGARFHYNTGRPYPVESAMGGTDYVRLPAFWQLDLRADKRVLLDRATLDIYLELGNATLTREVIAVQRDQPLGQPPTEQQVGFRIVLPSIGVHAEW
jgi:hypothetical protein